MREIKFRVFDINSEWVYFEVGEKFPTERYDINSLGQFTGLHDKNSKEIYEQDILATWEGEDLGWCCAGNVAWWADEAKFVLHDKDGYSSEDENADTPSEWKGYEIIGNIYENPEFLGVPTPKPN